MRRAATLALIAVMLVAGLPPWPSTQALHDTGELHGDLQPIPSESLLYFHCNEPNDDGDCDEETMTFSTSGLGSGSTGATAEPAAGTTSISFAFKESFTKGRNLTRDGSFEGGTAALFLTSLSPTGQDFTVEVVREADGGDEVLLESDPVTVPAQLGSEETVFDLDTPDGTPVTVQEGDTITVRVSGETSDWQMSLDRSDTPSRISFHGRLLFARTWIDGGDGPQQAYSIFAPDGERRFRPTMALDVPVFGRGMFQRPDNDDDDDLPQTTTPGFDASDVTTANCPNPTWKRGQGPDGVFVFRTGGSCTYANDQELGVHDLVWTIHGVSPNNNETIKCSGSGGCDVVSPIEFVERFDIELEAADDGTTKDGRPGETVVYQLRVRNEMSVAASFDLTIDGPEDWTVSLSRSAATIDGESNLTFRARVHVPEGAVPGQVGTSTVHVDVENRPEANPDPLELDTEVASSLRRGVEVQAVEPSATGQRGGSATYLVEIQNTGNVHDTLQNAVVNIPVGLSAEIDPSVELDAGERTTVQVEVSIPSDADDRLIQQPLPLTVRSRSTADPDVEGRTELILRILGEYEFDLEVLDRLHTVRTDLGGTGDCDGNRETPDPDPTTNTTWGTFFRVTVNNTGGNPDFLTFNDVTDAAAWREVGDEEVDDETWQVDVSNSTRFDDDGNLETSIAGDGIGLPSGEEVQFYVYTFRNHDASSQCRNEDDPRGEAQGPGGPFGPGDGVKVELTVQSSNGTQAEDVTLTMKAMTNETEVDSQEHQPESAVRVEVGHRTRDGRVVEPDGPIPIRAHEPTTLNYRVTNTGNYLCGDLNLIDQKDPPPAYRVHYSRLGWNHSVNASDLDTGMPGRVGDDNASVTYREATIQTKINPIADARAGDRVDSELTVQADCDHDGTIDATYNSTYHAVGRATDAATVPMVIEETRGLDLSVHGGPGDDVEVNPGGSATFNAEIKNNGTVRENMTVSLDTSAFPPGWGARVSGLASLHVPPLRAATVPVEVDVPEDASAGKEARLDVTVASEDGNLSRSATMSVTVRDPGDLRLERASETGAVGPGNATEFELTLINEGSDPQGSVTLDVLSVPPRWHAELLHDGQPRTSVSLDADEEKRLVLRVHAPDALAVSSAGFLVRAASGGSVATTPVQVHVADEFAVSLSVDRPTLAVAGGTPAEYRVVVENGGNGVDTIRLDHEDSPPAWRATMEQDKIVLGPDESKPIAFKVTPPRDAAPGISVPSRIFATSLSNPDREASLDVTTIVASFDPQLSTTAEVRRIGPGETTSIPFEINNNGTGADIINLATKAKPKGWTVEFDDPAPRVPGKSTETGQAHITPSATAAHSRQPLLVVVEGRSAFEPTEVGSVTFRIQIAQYVARDVDGDSVKEVAVDRDQSPSNGYEAFVDPGEGVRSRALLTTDADGDNRPDHVIDATGEGAATVFWAPSAETFTEVILLDVDGDGTDDRIFDTDGDGHADVLYDPEGPRLNPATSLDVDGDLADEYLVDTTGDHIYNRYFDTGDPRPGHVLRTQPELIQAGTYALDTNGDGSRDRIFDTQSGTVRSFTPLDALSALAVQYWYALVAFALVVVLFAGIRLSEPRREHVREPQKKD